MPVKSRASAGTKPIARPATLGGTAGPGPLPSSRTVPGEARQLGQDEGQRALAAARRPHQGHVLAGRQRELQVVQRVGPPVQHDAGLAEVVGPGQGRAGARGAASSRANSVRRSGRVEVGDDLLVLDPRVLLQLEEVDQLPPGLVELAVRLEERDQDTEVERVRAVDDEPAAHEQQEELAELLEEVVDPLDQVLEVVDVEPDLEDPLEQVPVPARLVGRRCRWRRSPGARPPTPGCGRTGRGPCARGRGTSR